MKPSRLAWAEALELASMALHNSARLWGSEEVSFVLRKLADRATARADRLRMRNPGDPQDTIRTSETPLGTDEDSETEVVTQMYGGIAPKPSRP